MKPLKAFCSEKGRGAEAYSRTTDTTLFVFHSGRCAYPGRGPLPWVAETTSGRLAWQERADVHRIARVP